MDDATVARGAVHGATEAGARGPLEDRVALQVEAYRRARGALDFLDANLWLGRPHLPECGGGLDLAALQAQMRRRDLRGGVVSHFASLYYAPLWGNERLLQDLAGSALWAGITLVPEMFDPEGQGRAYLARAIARGARLARLFPRTHNFTLRGWCCGALLRALADSCLPLVLWHTETSWEELRALAEAYPTLTLIVEGTPQKILYHSRQFYPLLESCANIHLELHNLVTFLLVEELAGRFGAERLIYGSYMPMVEPNATMMLVTHARLPDADKALIAHGNLARLLAKVRSS
jgi:uncharacterized protein